MSALFSIRVWLITIFLSSIAVLAYADATPNLYMASVPSQSQSEEERQILIKQGLEQVIERLSGETEIARNPEMKRALDNASDYLEQYSYKGNVLEMKFSPEQVNQLVYKSGKPTVSQPRQSKIVVWLALEDEQQQRRLIGSETDPKIQSYLAELSHQNGIPVILPLMDLEDVSAVSVTDVWGQFPLVLQQASQRYGANAILIGRIRQLKGNEWQANWQLMADKNPPTWEVRGRSLEDVIAQGIHNASGQFKGRASDETSPRAGYGKAKPFLIGVENVQSAGDFNKVEAYLRSLNQVVDVNVSQIVGNGVIFEITMSSNNTRYAFEKMMSTDPHFLASPNPAQFAEVDMVYRWIPPTDSHSSSRRWEEWENSFDGDDANKTQDEVEP
jgi:hypothetical protein